MSFLYGDSSASSLTINYVAFLKDALDLMVAVLCAEDRVKQGEAVREQKRNASEEELTGLMALGSDLTERLSRAEQLTSQSTRDAAERIRQATNQSIQEAAAAIKRQLDSSFGDLTSRRQKERESVLKALETFLLRHDLPDTNFHHSIKYAPGGAKVELSGNSACGINWVMSGDPARDSVFGSLLRVDRFAEGLEIQVPEIGGMMKKTLKFRAVKLGPKWVSELVVQPKEGHIKLRTSLEDNSEGFDIVIGPTRKVTCTRISRDGNEPFDPGDEDSGKLLKLYRDLSAAAAGMTLTRTALISATLDGKPLPAHDDPTVLCERLVGSMAPVVKEIAEHSMSNEELVLKRVMGEDRREEIFCSKADLRKKIVVAPEHAQNLFAPLGLGAGNGAVVRGTIPPPATRPTGNTRPPELPRP